MRESEIFKFFWHGRPLPLLQWACLKSFVTKGHRVNLYTYDDIDVPSGVQRLPADNIIPRSQIFYFDNDNNNIPADIAPFSDLFRLKLLRDHGGWYVDTDVICNESSFPACEFAWAQEFPEESPGIIGNSQIKFPAGSQIITKLYSECDQIKDNFTVREQLGPHLISRIIAEYPKPAHHVGSADTFYPLRWIEAYKFWLPSYREEVASMCKNALFVSCFNSLYSYMKLSGCGLPPKGSYLMDFYEKECPERVEGRIISEPEVLNLVKAFFQDREWAIQQLHTLSGEDALKRIGIS